MSLPAQPNRSLLHGVACLQAVAAADRPLGCRELARRLDSEPTRISRLLGTLAHLGLVERTATRKYRPGPVIHLLSAQSLRGSGLLAAALPALQVLTGRSLTIALGMLWREEVCYLVYAQPGQRLAEAIGAHSPYPAWRSVLGQALLAREEPSTVTSRHAAALAPDDQRTLQHQLTKARRCGYACAPAEDGRDAVAVAVGDPPVAALGVIQAAGVAVDVALVNELHGIAAKIVTILETVDQGGPPPTTQGLRV